jgi:hypothetical protein
MGENKLKIEEPVVQPQALEVLEGTTKEASSASASAVPKKKKKKSFSFMQVFGIFERQQIVNLMPFILFLTFLILIYIGNSYYAERTIRQIDKTKTELKEKRAEFISTSSELMFRTKQSEVAKAIAREGLKESVEPQKKIMVVTDNSKNKE